MTQEGEEKVKTVHKHAHKQWENPIEFLMTCIGICH